MEGIASRPVSGSLATTTPNTLRTAQWLGTVVLGCALVALSLLIVRVWWIQTHVSAAHVQDLRRQHTATITIMPERAEIHDSTGTLLAGSIRMYNLFADPMFIVDPEGTLVKAGDSAALQKRMTDELVIEARHRLVAALTPLLNEAPGATMKFRPEELDNYLQENTFYANGKGRRFLWLAREVDEPFYLRFMEVKEQLRQQAKELAKEASNIRGRDPATVARRQAQIDQARATARTLDAVGFVRSVKRVYPMGELAGHVLGMANRDGGVDGMELQLEDLLRGRPGKMIAVKDSSRRSLWVEDENFRVVDDGRAVWLTIDATLQRIVEEELAATCTDFRAKGGSAVLLEPTTGKILAMANYPTFTPAQFNREASAERRNKAVVDPYEPGSIFKPFVAAWAMEKGIVRRGDVFNCHGGHYVDPTGRMVTDAHGEGVLTVEGILIKSSNVGMTQIGWKMGLQELHNGVRAFGFGRRTGVELPGDSRGLVRPYPLWNKGTLTSVSFGYEIAATPLQLVRGFATFANGGYLVTPQVIHAVANDKGKAQQWSELAGPPLQERIISETTARSMREILEGVYITGTAKRNASKMYRLFGKTGTAHLAIQGQGQYASDQYNSSFLCGGPVERPRVVLVMSVHQPDRRLGHFGGTVAAPAATRILERSLMYMQVPPDQLQVNAGTPGTRRTGNH